MWLEDMLMPGNYAQYHELAAATSLPLIAGNGWREAPVRTITEPGTVKYVMLDAVVQEV